MKDGKWIDVETLAGLLGFVAVLSAHHRDIRCSSEMGFEVPQLFFDCFGLHEVWQLRR